jgi:hypothetical protein
LSNLSRSINPFIDQSIQFDLGIFAFLCIEMLSCTLLDDNKNASMHDSTKVVRDDNKNKNMHEWTKVVHKRVRKRRTPLVDDDGPSWHTMGQGEPLD